MADLKVVVTMPTGQKEHVGRTVARWRARGYTMAFFFDPGPVKIETEPSDIIIQAPYPGVWNACNALAKTALECGADVCLFAGDDMDPDPTCTAQQIAEQYLARFPTGWGLMQPCGDPQGTDASGRPAAARICGSAWFGKQWIQRAYGGRGPTPTMYHHYFGDEEMAEVGNREGLLWWRPDLVQFHRHWSFGHQQRQDYHARAATRWEADKATFEVRKAAGFPGVI